MKTVFADTYYYIALLSPSDAAHDRVVEWTRSFRGRMITTQWVLTELADGMARSADRPVVAQFIRELETNPGVTLVPFSQEFYRQGLDLYESRQDKQWSLTDCVSFTVMDEHELTEAATGDHHFNQAGYSALLT